MNNIYIVSKVGWDYNDENYYKYSEEAVIPKIAFQSLEAAEKECDSLNFKAFKEYAKELQYFDPLFRDEVINCVEDSLYHQFTVRYGYELTWNQVSMMCDEELKGLIPFLNFQFYEISEIVYETV